MQDDYIIRLRAHRRRKTKQNKRHTRRQHFSLHTKTHTDYDDAATFFFFFDPPEAGAGAAEEEEAGAAEEAAASSFSQQICCQFESIHITMSQHPRHSRR